MRVPRMPILLCQENRSFRQDKNKNINYKQIGPCLVISIVFPSHPPSPSIFPSPKKNKKILKPALLLFPPPFPVIPFVLSRTMSAKYTRKSIYPPLLTLRRVRERRGRKEVR